MSKSQNKDKCLKKIGIFEEDLGVEPNISQNIEFYVNKYGQLEKSTYYQNHQRNKEHSRKVSIAKKNDYQFDIDNFHYEDLSNQLPAVKISRQKKKCNTVGILKKSPINFQRFYNNKLNTQDNSNNNSNDLKLILNENFLFNPKFMSIQSRKSVSLIREGNCSEINANLSLINLRKLLNSNEENSNTSINANKMKLSQDINPKIFQGEVKQKISEIKMAKKLNSKKQVNNNTTNFHLKYIGRLSNSPINDFRFDPQAVSDIGEFKNNQAGNRNDINNFYVTEENLLKNHQTNSEKKKNKKGFNFFKMCFCK